MLPRRDERRAGTTIPVALGSVVAIAGAAPEDAESLEGVCVRVVELLRVRREEIARAIGARVREAVPGTLSGEDPKYWAGVESAIGELLEYSFEGMAQDPGCSGELPAPAAAQARRAARLGVGVGVVVRRYVAGGRRLSELVAEVAEVGGYARHESAMRYLRERQAALLEHLTGAIEGEYERERGRLSSSPPRRRATLVRRLLAGEPVDPAQAAELEYELHGRWHVGVVLAGERAQETVRALTRELGRGLLWVGSEQKDVVWAWLGNRGEPAHESVQRLATAGEAAGLSVGIGEPGRGSEGWRLSHRQAREALALAALKPERVARYGDAPLLAAALNSETLTQSLTALLARLDRDDSGAKLRRTLRAYLDRRCNASATSSLLGMGRHTVESHVNAAEFLLGGTVHSRLAELDVALRLDELEHRG